MESQRGPPRTMTRETEVAFRWPFTKWKCSLPDQPIARGAQPCHGSDIGTRPRRARRLPPLGGGWTQAKGDQADKIGELSDRWLIAPPIFISHPARRGPSVSLCCGRAPLCTLKQKPDSDPQSRP